MSFSLVTAGVLAHVGGIPTQAYFDAPVGVGNVVDQQMSFGWQDNDTDPTGMFSFAYQPYNLRPNGKAADLVGTPIPNGQQVPIMDPNDVLTWDLALVPSGSYFVYAVTQDDPLPPVFGMSRGVVTVQHPGDPLYPAVVVTEPASISPPVADAFAIKWEASGVGPLTATVRGKARDDAGELVDLASNVPMAESGGKFTGCYLWNLSGKTQGYYEVQVEVVDAAGLTHAAYSVTNITLYRDPQPTDAGVPASCESPPAAPDGGLPTIDAGDPSVVDMGEGSCGCRVASGKRDVQGGAWVLAMVALALGRARRPRS